LRWLELQILAAALEAHLEEHLPALLEVLA
jgi:hypothetical protein